MNTRPESASSLPINLTGVACYFLVLVITLHYNPDIAFIPLFILSILAVCVPVVLLELVVLKVHHRPDAGMLPVKRPVDNTQIKLKVTGLNATLFVLFLAYIFFPEYQQEKYHDYLLLFCGTGVLIMGGGFLYINAAEHWLPDTRDGFWQVGAWLRGRRGETNVALLKEHWKRWLIKGFFLPLMISGWDLFYQTFWQGHLLFSNVFVKNTDSLPAHSFAEHFSIATLGWNDYLLLTIFFMTSVDMVFGVIGYLMTFRVLDADIKSTEPTLFGWVVCIMCYPPIWYIFSQAYFNIGDEQNWQLWLKDYPALFFCWGLIVLAGHAVNSLCTITFGLRFSNLTYRRLITGGFYRYSKHPQYIAKWVTWLFSFVPFIALGGLFSGLCSFLALCAVGGIYYLRARSEENHCSNYPEYVAYAEWIEQHGIFRKIGERIPCLRYSQARAQQSGSIIWQKKAAVPEAGSQHC